MAQDLIEYDWEPGDNHVHCFAHKIGTCVKLGLRSLAIKTYKSSSGLPEPTVRIELNGVPIEALADHERASPPLSARQRLVDSVDCEDDGDNDLDNVMLSEDADMPLPDSVHELAIANTKVSSSYKIFDAIHLFRHTIYASPSPGPLLDKQSSGWRKKQFRSSKDFHYQARMVSGGISNTIDGIGFSRIALLSTISCNIKMAPSVIIPRIF